MSEKLKAALALIEIDLTWDVRATIDGNVSCQSITSCLRHHAASSHLVHMQTTSFDSPRTVPHHNPFTSFHDTTDDPLASTSTTSFYNHAASSSAADPWSSYYSQTVNSTTNGSSSKLPALNALSSAIDEETVPDLYKETWSVISSSSSATGSTFAAGSTISLSVLQKTLTSAAGLSAGEIEKVR